MNLHRHKAAPDLNPCVRNCCLDQYDVCCGCKRTLDEILNWHKMSVAEKLTLIAELNHRRNQQGNPNSAPGINAGNP